MYITVCVCVCVIVECFNRVTSKSDKNMSQPKTKQF